jgi:hypothetical protein
LGKVSDIDTEPLCDASGFDVLASDPTVEFPTTAESLGDDSARSVETVVFDELEVGFATFPTSLLFKQNVSY